MMKNTTFSERVVQIALAIPKGRVMTYGGIAQLADGSGPMSAQSISGILSKASRNGVKNIPYHRIVYADGRVWMDGKCRAHRLKLYEQEGIELDDKDRIVNFKNIAM